MMYFEEASRSLTANRLRTALTIIGLIVGVGSVVAIQILGHGMAGATMGIFQGFSNYTFLVSPNSSTSGYDPNANVALSDLAALSSIPNVELAIPFYSVTESARFSHSGVDLAVAPIGYQSEFVSEPLSQGRLLTADDVDEGSRVCVLSDNAAEKLSSNDPQVLLGNRIRVGTLDCEVVGVLEKPPSGLTNFNVSADIYLPYTLFERHFMPDRRTYSVEVLVSDISKIGQTEILTKDAVSELKHNKFTYQTFDAHVVGQLVDKLFGTLTLIVGVIAAISLVVAGIGIMNILLVSINERIAEIGVRKAIGARRTQIMSQFLAEAGLLSITGCSLGAGFGIIVGWWVNSNYLIKISGVIVPVPWASSLALAIGFALLITFAFGTYPAYRAASLDPVEALRHE